MGKWDYELLRALRAVADPRSGFAGCGLALEVDWQALVKTPKWHCMI